MREREQTYATQQNGEVETPNQMRAEIFRHEYDHPIIRQVMTVADVNGYSAEDRYTTLAFWLLKDNITMREWLMATTASTPKPIVTVLAEDLERTEKQRDLLGSELNKTRNSLDAIGVAISNAGYEWTPEMMKAYEDGTK